MLAMLVVAVCLVQFCHCVLKGLAEPTVQKGTKQTLIFNPPAVLTIHLKRFEQVQLGVDSLLCLVISVYLVILNNLLVSSSAQR